MGTGLARLFLVVFAVSQAVELGLEILNLRHLARSRGVPRALKGLVRRKAAEQGRAYALASGRLLVIRRVAGALATLALLFSGALPALDRALAGLGLEGAHRFAAYLALVTAAVMATDLPFVAWRTFAVEARFGFNRAGARLFLADRARGLALTTAFGLPFLYAIYGFMSFAGPRWWLWLFALVVVIQVLLHLVWPVLLAPLFQRHVALPECSLRDRLEALARQVGVRLGGLYVADTARRTGHANAAVCGLVRPRIVFDEALLDRLTEDEVLGVLAHELAHYRLHHLPLRACASLGGTLALLVTLGWAVDWAPLHAAFGFAGPSLHGTLALVSLAGGALLFWVSPIQASWSRRHEAEADRFALQLTGQPEALASAVRRLSADNLANPWPHPWYVAWRFSHPPLGERLSAISHAAAAR